MACAKIVARLWAGKSKSISADFPSGNSVRREAQSPHLRLIQLTARPVISSRMIRLLNSTSIDCADQLLTICEELPIVAQKGTQPLFQRAILTVKLLKNFVGKQIAKRFDIVAPDLKLHSNCIILDKNFSDCRRLHRLSYYERV